MEQSIINESIFNIRSQLIASFSLYIKNLHFIVTKRPSRDIILLFVVGI